MGPDSAQHEPSILCSFEPLDFSLYQVASAFLHGGTILYLRSAQIQDLYVALWLPRGGKQRMSGAQGVKTNSKNRPLTDIFRPDFSPLWEVRPGPGLSAQFAFRQ